MNELDDSLFDLDFLAEEKPQVVLEEKPPYRVLITDDDEEVHVATVLLLKHFKFEGHKLELLHAYSGNEARKMLQTEPNLALIFLDVVMEESDTGLKLVNYIRNELGNRQIRIILRTGQPGEAPEEEVIATYDINDYRLKTELSATRLYTSVYEALRSYRDIMAIESHRLGLQQLVQMSSKMFTHRSVEGFYSSLLHQILNLETSETSAICFRETNESSGFVFFKDCPHCKIVAATGKYECYANENSSLSEEVHHVIEQALSLAELDCNEVNPLASGYLISRCSPDGHKTFIYIEGVSIDRSLELLKDFMCQYDLALDYFVMSHQLNALNLAFMKTLPEALLNQFVESELQETRLSHLKTAFLAQFQTKP